MPHLVERAIDKAGALLPAACAPACLVSLSLQCSSGRLRRTWEVTEAFPWLPTATLLGLVPGATSSDASCFFSMLAFAG